MILFRAAVTIAALLGAIPGTAAADTARGPERGKPFLTAQTMRSGGERPAEQRAIRFDTVDLAIEVMPATRSIAAVATLGFTATAPLARLVIDLDRNLPVGAIAVDGVALSPRDWSDPDGRLTIRLPRPLLPGGRVTVRIDYAGTPHVAVNAPWDDGFVWATTPDGKPWVATTTEGYGCDLFWPCLDFPGGEPGVVDLHITVPAGLKAPANGRLLKVDTLPDGRTTWHWRTRDPNTYAIALNVGPYDELRASYASRYGNAIPLHYWYLPAQKPQAEALFAEFAPTLDFFEATVGPYPFGAEKVGVVETPHMGMEHQTINAHGNGFARTAEGFDTLFQHELSHEWFANQLTAADWDDYWLHEGYATYMQPLYGEWREGRARYAAMMQAERVKIAAQVPLVRGRSITEEEVYDAKRGGPGQDIYSKGAWVLHTLRWLIGDPAFRQVTRLAVYGRADPQPGNFRPRYGSTADYERVVRQVTGRDLTWFFDVYLRRAALPELVVTRGPARVQLVWNVPGGGAFPMPVDVEIDGTVHRVAMPGGRGSVPAGAGAHIVIDPDAHILLRNPAIEAMQAARRASAGTRGGAGGGAGRP